ncbi:MAG: hypothetical protein K2I62_03625 [Alistipes sp.]|nr:hypothetical protein [Alistipes sp.]
MIPISFLCRSLCAGWLAVTAVSCAASRGGSRVEQTVSQQTGETCSAVASCVAGERFVRSEVIATSEPVAACCVAAAVPLVALRALPEGAQFAARQGFLTVEAHRCGDTLVVAARSDSLPRRVVRTARTEACFRHDSAVCRFSERRATADTLRLESRTGTLAPPSRRNGCWGFFLAGVAVCAAGAVWLRCRR